MINRDRLKNVEKYISDLINQEILNQKIPGASISVLYKGREIIRKEYGFANIKAKRLVDNKTIFRLYSMGKPIAAVAAYILIERGKIDLNAPVWEYLPCFKTMKIYTESGLLDSKSEILIKDLLNMTSGIVYPDPDPVGNSMNEIFNWIEQQYQNGNKPTILDVIDLISSKPLAFEPGKKWRYGLSTDVMGGVIEVVSGQNLSEFYSKEIFEPLNMNDTGFFVAQEKHNYLAELYSYDEQANGEKLKIEKEYALGLTDCLTPPSIEMAGAGLLSTMDDYLKFASVLVDKDSKRERKILGRKTLELLCRDQMTEDQRNSIYFDHMAGYGYGNYMRFYHNSIKASCSGDVGEFGWDGWTGPYMSINQKEDLVIVFMTQRCGYSNPQLIRKLRNIIYGLI